MIRPFLELLGRQARWALPIGVLIGIAVPQLATLARPYLTLAVIGTLAVTLVRLNWAAMARAVRKPLLPMTMAIWQLMLTPLLVWALSNALGLPAALGLALILQSASAPVGSAAAFALFVGIDGERVLILTVLTTILLPVTLTPLVALVLTETSVQIDLLSFFVRVSLLVAAPFAIAWLVRRVTGVARLRRNETLMAGLNVLMLVIFAIAVMDGVTDYMISNPIGAAQLTLLSFVAAIVLHAAAYLMFRAFGHETALVAALASGNRNMGLMLAITAGTAGQTTAIYFGLAQIPMYCVPLLLGPLVRSARRAVASAPH